MTAFNSASNAAPVPPSAYMLADHLDATLAAGEDMIGAGRRCREIYATAPEPRALGKGQQVALRSAVDLIRSLELALITRVTKAREWSQQLVRLDPRFRPIGSLFIAGTAPLVDALAEFADATESDFETGDGIVAYFRARGMLDPEMASLAEVGGPLVSESFLVTRRIELGPLMDLTASYLDALEDHFALFEAAEKAAQAAVAAGAATASAGTGVTPAAPT